jgi:hypothetical protein
MKARIHQITFGRSGRLARAVFRYRSPDLRRETPVTVEWRDVAGSREWFALGWCPPDAWMAILPLLAQVTHAVDTIQSGEDGWCSRALFKKSLELQSLNLERFSDLFNKFD